MSAWPPVDARKAVDLAVVGPLLPIEVLYDFDGPCIFVARTASETLVLAYLSEDLKDEHLLRFVVSTTSDVTVSKLKTGLISVREALEMGSLWLVDLDDRRAPKRAFAVALGALPEDALPLAGTMLWASLEPALVVRIEG
ncbi:MAG: hypothetical protein HY791_28790 [Deltaproteobacteria bacterium]|nr:hypothetical protein [Deltaproteobacteria bacterium]